MRRHLQRGEIGEYLLAGVARFLREKLDAEDWAVTNDGREVDAVVARRMYVNGVERFGVGGMVEIEVLAGGQPGG